jgi:hypothetical protein
MNINEMTIGEAKEIAAMFGAVSQSNEPAFPSHVGKLCLIRTYASGVHAGTLAAQSGRQVMLKNARRLWKWHAKDGISLSEVAMTGIDQSKSRICAVVSEMTITDALEIIPLSASAAASIFDAEVASK